MSKSDEIRVPITFPADVSEVKAALKEVKSGMEKLNTSKSFDTSLVKSIENIKDKIGKLQDYISREDINPIDFKKALSEFNQLETSYKSMMVRIKQEAAGNILFKGDTKALDALKKAQKDFTTELSASKKQAEFLKNEVLITEKALSKLKSKQESTKRQITAKQNTVNSYLGEGGSVAAAEKAVKIATKRAQEKVDNSKGKYSNIREGKTDRGNFQLTKEYKDLIVAEQTLEKLKANAEKAQGALENLKARPDLSKDIQEAEENLAKAKDNSDKFNVSLKKIESDKIDNLKEKLFSIKDIKWDNYGIKPEDINSFEDLGKAIEVIESKGGPEAKKAIEEILNTASHGQESLAPLRKGLDDTRDSMDKLISKSNDIEQFRQRLVDFFGIQNAVQLFKTAIREAYQAVTELDAAATETAVVTDMSVGDLWGQLSSYTKMANELGTTTLGAYQTATLFYQQGLKTNEVMEVSNETMKMARIAGMDYTEATNMMTAALRGFNMEINNTSAQRINDVYSELAKITASDTQEISSAMTKTASIASNAGMEFETTAAFLSQIIETTREAPETAGTALKTVIARFQELKKDPSEIQAIDGEMVDANKVEAALKTAGVALRNTKGEFRELDDVFLELASKWDTLDKKTQRYIATTAAGSRQQSRFIAMMSNYDRTMELVNAANNSAGSSQEQFAKTTESLESKINKLKNAYEAFTMNLANSSIIKGAVDFLTGLLTIVNNITTGFGTLNGTAASFALSLGLIIKTFKSLKNLSGKYGDKFFGGIKTLLDPEKVRAPVEAGAQSAIIESKPIIASAFEDATYAGVSAGLIKAKAEMQGDSFTSDFSDLGKIENDNNMLALPSKGGSSASSDKKSNLFTNSFKGQLEKNKADATGLDKIFYDLASSSKSLKGGFKNLATKGVSSAASSLASLVTPTSALIVGITLASLALKKITETYDKNTETSTERLNNLDDALADTNKSINKFEEVLNNITNQKDQYKELKNSMEALTKGTKEYNEAQRQANSIIREIITENPEMAGKAKYVNGQYQVDDSFWREYESSTNEKITNANERAASLRIDKADAEIQKNIDDLGFATDSITQSEQEVTKTAAYVTGTLVAIGAGLAALAAPFTGGASLALVAGSIAAGAAAGGTAATGVGYSVSKSQGQFSNADLRTFAKALGEERNSFTKEDIKAITDELKNSTLSPENQHLVENVFGDTEKAKAFFNEIGNGTDSLNKMIEAQRKYSDYLDELRGESTNNDPNSKYYFGNEKVAQVNDRVSREIQDITKSAWTKKGKQNQSITIGENTYQLKDLLGNILNKDEYEQDEDGIWISKTTGKAVELGGQSTVTKQLTAEAQRLAREYEAAEGKKTFENKGTEEKEADYQYEYDRKKFYKTKGFKIDKQVDPSSYEWITPTLQQENKLLDSNIVKDLSFNREQMGTLMAFFKNEADNIEGKDINDVMQYYIDNFGDESFESVDEFIEAVKTGIENSDIKFLTEADDSKVKEWGDTEKWGAESRINAYNLAFDLDGQKSIFTDKMADIISQLKDGGEEIFKTMDLSTVEGIEKFVKSLQDGGVDIEKTFGKTSKELTEYLKSTLKQNSTAAEKLEAARKASAVAEEIIAKQKTKLSKAEYETAIAMNKDMKNDFVQVGDSFYYVMGSANQLATALSDAAKATYEDYMGILTGEKDISGKDYNNLTEDQKKKWTYQESTGKYKYNGYTGSAEYKEMTNTMGYNTEGFYQVIDQTGSVDDVQKALDKNIITVDEAERAYKRLAIAAGMTTEELAGIKKEDLKATAALAQHNKQVTTFKAGLTETFKTLKKYKEETTGYDAQISSIAEQLSTQSGGTVSEDFVKKNLKDIQDMAAGSEEAADRLWKKLKQTESWARSWAENQVEVSKTILDSAYSTAFNLNGLTDTLYTFQLTGTADFTQLFTALLAAGNTIDQAKQKIEELAGTSIEFKVEGGGYQTTKSPAGASVLSQWGYTLVSTAADGTMTWYKPGKVTGTTTSNNKNSNPFGGGLGGKNTSSGSKGGGGGSKTEPWKNPYDKMYNMVQKINLELRKREALEKRYDLLLKKRTATYKDLKNITMQQVSSLQAEQIMQSKLASGLWDEMQDLLGENWAKTGYITLNYDDPTGRTRVSINPNELEKIKSSDFGKEVEEFGSKLEDLNQRFLDAMDSADDLELQIIELLKRGRDEYLSFEQDVYDATVKQHQSLIDNYSKFNSTLSQQSSDILADIQDSISKQRQERDNQKTEKDLADKEARLMAMRRDTGSTAAEILAAEKELTDARESYTDQLIDQKISELQKQNQDAQALREKQISLMEAQLEQDQNSGLIWKEVQKLMDEGWGADGKIIEKSELNEILKKYYEWTKMSDEQRKKKLEEQEEMTLNASVYKTPTRRYATGGIADFTGPAWLDGTPTRPEIILNQKDSQNFIKLKDILGSLFNRNINNSQNNGDNYFDIHINVESMANDYDVDKLAKRIKEEINSDARYRNVNAINILR